MFFFQLHLSSLNSPKETYILPIPKVNTLCKEHKESINTNNDYSASQAAVCQANLKVLVNAEEAQKQPTAAYTKSMKQSIHTISNSHNTFIIKNSNRCSQQLASSVKNNIDKHSLNYSSSLKSTNPLAKSVTEKLELSKKDPHISTSKRSSHKSLSLKPSDKVKAFVVDKNKDVKYALHSTKNIDTKQIPSNFNKNTSLLQNKHHTSEENSENKSKIINFKHKDIPCKSREFKDKFRNEILDKTSGKSKKGTPNHQTSKESIIKPELDRRSSSHNPKQSTNKCIETSSKDISIEKYKSSSKSLFDYKKCHKDDLVNSNIKSKVVKPNYPSRTLKFLKQGDKVVEVLCKSEHRKLDQSVLNSPSKYKTKTSSEQTKSVVKSCSTRETTTAEQMKQNELTDLRQKLSHRSFSELFSKKRYQNLCQEKHDNLKITASKTQESKKTESDSEEQLESPTNVKTSTPKSVKYKTIELVINIRYEQPTTASEKSSDLSGNKVDTTNNLSNMDFSFLDEINIDEIVNSLKDCENNSELSKSGAEIFVGSTVESSLDSTLSLQSRKSINNKTYIDNRNMSNELLRLVSIVLLIKF